MNTFIGDPRRLSATSVYAMRSQDVAAAVAFRNVEQHAGN